MKAVFEIIGRLIISLLLMAIPIICTLSFVYNWYAGLKINLIVACVIEYIGLMSMLWEIGDKQDER